MFKHIIIVIILTISMVANVIAADKVPREDFLKYVDGCIDILDELEIAFTKPNITEYEAGTLTKKYDLCLKKFNRYGKFEKWDKNSLQTNIVGTFNFIALQYASKYWDLKAGSTATETDGTDINKIAGKEAIKKKTEEVKDKVLNYREAKATKKRLK